MTDRQKALADAILSGTVTARPEAPRRAGCVGRGADMAASRAVKSVAVQSYMAGQIAVKHGYARGLADQSLALVGRGVTRAAAVSDHDPVLAVGVGAKAISASAEYLERIGERAEAPQDLTRAALKAAADLM